MEERNIQHVAPDAGFFRNLIRGRTRVYLAWIFAVLLIFFSRQYPTWPGILLCFFGATIRFWASGFLRKDTRPAVGGPYAWVRNPLYLGTYLMALGTALSVQAWGLLLFASIAFAIVYHYIILDEETKLQEIFGEPYLKYCFAVPRFFPRFTPASAASMTEVNPEPTYRHYSWEVAKQNRAHEPYATWIALMVLVSACAWTLQRFGNLT
jgi:protein-S-isoprenylcysteine O-methyltransferase Ste14